MNTWTTCTIRDLVARSEAEVKTGPFGTQLHASDYVERGVPMINARNIGFGDVRLDKLDYLSEETVARLSSHLLRAGDIVFGRKGTVERHAFIHPQHAGWFQGTDCLRLRFKSPSVEPRFVSYCFMTDTHQRWMINQSSHGATMTSLNQDIIGRIELRLPPLPVQRKIAAILSAYDDLIENNTRRIQILEEMAQALYREWFVRFRFPGHERVRLVDSALGPIPEGWKVVKVGDIADINASCVGRGQDPLEIHYIDISSVSTGRVDTVQRLAFADAPSRARRLVKHGDIIWSTVRPNRRSYSVILQPPPNLVVSTGFAVITAQLAPYSYLYYALTTDDFVGYLTNHATGAAYPAVSANDFEEARVVLPPSEVTDAFHSIVADLLEQKHTLGQRNVNLCCTRDLLLLKLVSGEVDMERT